LTTPTPDHLPKSFYQTPVILERRPQTTSSTQSSIIKPAPESSPQAHFSSTISVREEIFNRATSVNALRTETKSISIKGKALERPFVKMINEKGVFNNESVLKVGC